MFVLAYKMLEHPRVPTRLTDVDSFATAWQTRSSIAALQVSLNVVCAEESYQGCLLDAATAAQSLLCSANNASFEAGLRSAWVVE
jgi:hypothetical protein